MPLPRREGRAATRAVALRLGDDAALTTTTLTFAEATPRVELTTAFGSVEVSTDGVGRCSVETGRVRLRGLEAGARVVVSGRVDYRPTPHGLSRWTDPDDGSRYVIGSGALGGAAHFLACTEAPDRLPTRLSVEAAGVLRTTRACRTDDARDPTTASHHLALVAGPWRCQAGDGVELLSRRALGRSGDLDALVADTRRALDWLLDWFDATGAPWDATYTQVLLPAAPWLAMEHPGCVLLSERLLAASRGQRVAVLAHEAAHQWLGNLVSPLAWSDAGVFEGLAELLGQLACEAIVGAPAAGDLARRRSAGPLTLPSTRSDLRTLAATAGLAEVAGPVQHAELFREVRSHLGAETFRSRVRGFVRRHAGSACGAGDLWAALGLPPREPRTLRLPVLPGTGSSEWRTGLDRLRHCDPATAARSARRALLERDPGPARFREALSAMADPATPYPVVAGLAAALSRPDRENLHSLV